MNPEAPRWKTLTSLAGGRTQPLSFRAKRGICFLMPYQAHRDDSDRAKLKRVCVPSSRTQKLVILSAAKDLRGKPRPVVSRGDGLAVPISIFQFPFSIQPGGNA